MIFERNVKSYKEFVVLEWRDMERHAMAFALACQGICLGMPKQMPWHAQAYALACPGICLGMHAKAWVRHASQMPPQTTGEGREGA